MDFNNNDTVIEKRIVLSIERNVAEVELKISSYFIVEYNIPDPETLSNEINEEWKYLGSITDKLEIKLSYSLIIDIDITTNMTKIIEFDLNPIYNEIENKMKNAL